MLKRIVILLALSSACADDPNNPNNPGKTKVQTCDVIAPPTGFDAIYVKYLNIKGIPIVATAGVDEEALLLADGTMEFMLIGLEDLAARMRASSYYYALYGDGMVVADLPEFRGISTNFVGYSNERATTSSGVAILCKTDELFDDTTNFFESNNFVHEFTHVIHYEGYGEGSSKEDEIRAAYRSARSAGRWNDTYAAQDFVEYFAELATIWFEVGRKKGDENGDGTRNHVTTRDELRAYDPDGHALVSLVFNDRLDPPGYVQRRVIHPYLDPALSCESAVTDADGNSYPVVRVGNQCWMAANLATTRFASGVAIPEVIDDAAWAAATTPSRADYDNNPANVPARGRSYNFAAVVAPDGLCPEGMRIPGDEDIKKLRYFMDPRYEINEAVLISAVGEWSQATDVFGFAAKPSGIRDTGGGFSGLVSNPPDAESRWTI